MSDEQNDVFLWDYDRENHKLIYPDIIPEAEKWNSGVRTKQVFKCAVCGAKTNYYYKGYRYSQSRALCPNEDKKWHKLNVRRYEKFLTPFYPEELKQWYKRDIDETLRKARQDQDNKYVESNVKGKTEELSLTTDLINNIFYTKGWSVSIVLETEKKP